MRGICIGLLAGALCLGAGSAQALSIDPNPVHIERTAGDPGGSLSADLYAISITGNTAIYQVSVSLGTITGIDIGMLFDDLDAPSAFNFIAGAAVGGGGVGGTAGIGFGNAEAQFDFAGGINAGQTSAQLIVTFASDVTLGWEGSVDFDNGYASTERYAVAASAPEAGALLLLGLSLGGLALVRRGTR